MKLLRAVALLFSIPTVVGDVFSTDLESFQDGAFGKQPNQTYVTSDLVSPVFQINKLDLDDERLDQHPYIFLNGDYNEHSGPFIFSARDLSLIWAYRGPAHSTSVNLGIMDGEPIVTAAATDADKAIMIFNQRYERMYTTGPAGEYAGNGQDPHEAFITDNNTVVLVTGSRSKSDMRAFGGGENQEIRDCVVQEIDPHTDELLFESSTLDYFNLNDTMFGGDGDYDHIDDFAHINSIQKTPTGDFLVGARHLWAIWLLDGKTGERKWTLGGKQNQFTDISESGTYEFRWQHHTRMVAPNRITIFDNHHLSNGYCNEGDTCTRGLELELDFEAMTVKKVGEWFHPQNLRSASRGGVTRLPNGNTLIAWGQNPMYTEHTPDGTIVMDFQRGQVLEIEHGIVGAVAYRAYKSDWKGAPRWGLSVAARKQGDETKIYMSWNGATEVHRYRLMTSDSRAGLIDAESFAADSPRTGFETIMTLANDAKYVRVAAMDFRGTLLGVSPVLDVANDEMIIDDMYTEIHGTHKPDGDAIHIDTHPGRTDKSGNGFPSWLMGVIAAAVVICLILAMWFGIRCLRRTEWWTGQSWSHAPPFNWSTRWSSVPHGEDGIGHEDAEKLLAAGDRR